MKHPILSGALLAATLLLTACGGSGGGGGDDTPPPPVAENHAPIADAGADISCVPWQPVTLNGSNSRDPDGDEITWVWSLESAPAASHERPDIYDRAVITYTPDVEGAYVFKLMVGDLHGNTPLVTTDTVTIECVANNAPPVANAGAPTVALTYATLTLDGSSSYDPNRDTLSYQWLLVSAPADSTATLAGADTVAPTFTPDMNGDYTFSLVVSDGQFFSGTSTVKITALYYGVPPVADAGPDQNVAVMNAVELDGSASHDDDEGDALDWSWSIVSKPAGSTATLVGANTVNPAFVADVAGQYVVRLTLDPGVPVYDTVVVTAVDGNVAPVADAGDDQAATTGQEILLSARASHDGNSDDLIYQWQVVSAPAGSAASLADAALVEQLFTPDVAGTYVLSVTVSDGVLQSTNSMTVTVTDPALTLYVKSGIINPTYTAVSMPYLSNTTISATILGSSTVLLGDFMLEASGQDYTVQNVTVTVDTAGVSVQTGLRDGDVITGGSSVGFNLTSGKTGGATVHIRFSFSVVETGKTFVANYALTTN